MKMLGCILICVTLGLPSISSTLVSSTTNTLDLRIVTSWKIRSTLGLLIKRLTPNLWRVSLRIMKMVIFLLQSFSFMQDVLTLRLVNSSATVFDQCRRRVAADPASQAEKQMGVWTNQKWRTQIQVPQEGSSRAHSPIYMTTSPPQPVRKFAGKIVKAIGCAFLAALHNDLVRWHGTWLQNMTWSWFEFSEHKSLASHWSSCHGTNFELCSKLQEKSLKMSQDCFCVLWQGDVTWLLTPQHCLLEPIGSHSTWNLLLTTGSTVGGTSCGEKNCMKNSQNHDKIVSVCNGATVEGCRHL